jgi:hypothetical protein
MKDYFHEMVAKVGSYHNQGQEFDALFSAASCKSSVTIKSNN